MCAVLDFRILTLWKVETEAAADLKYKYQPLNNIPDTDIGKYQFQTVTPILENLGIGE